MTDQTSAIADVGPIDAHARNATPITRHVSLYAQGYGFDSNSSTKFRVKELQSQYGG
jgi:hypothetical protein